MVYYGSTQQQVCCRMNDHRKGYKKWKKTNNNIYFTTSYLIFDHGEYEYATLEKVEFQEIFELRNRERFYIENNKCVNCRIPNRTNKEWIEANKERFKEKKKVYREANKEKVDAQQKAYREANREKIEKQKKVYREANKEKVDAQQKAYREANREKINAKAKVYREKKRQEKMLKLTESQ